MRTKVLSLCTHNSARSQMAERWLRHLGEGRFDVHSAAFRAAREELHTRILDELISERGDQQSAQTGRRPELGFR